MSGADSVEAARSGGLHRHAQWQKLTVLGLGYVFFLGTAIWLATFPVTVSV